MLQPDKKMRKDASKDDAREPRRDELYRAAVEEGGRGWVCRKMLRANWNMKGSACDSRWQITKDRETHIQIQI